MALQHLLSTGRALSLGWNTYILWEGFRSSFISSRRDVVTFDDLIHGFERDSCWKDSPCTSLMSVCFFLQQSDSIFTGRPHHNLPYCRYAGTNLLLLLRCEEFSVTLPLNIREAGVIYKYECIIWLFLLNRGFFFFFSLFFSLFTKTVSHQNNLKDATVV